MCGRYSQTCEAKTLAQRFRVDVSQIDIAPRYNVAPTHQAPVLIEESGRKLRLMRWGLVPSWAKDPSIGNKMINARAETLSEKPSFKKSLERRRCLIPADGFYEWAHLNDTKAKVPLRFVLKSREPFAFAGLWDRWQKPAGGELRSFTIITTSANENIKPIHDRMPVILKQEDEGKWLDTDIRDFAELTSLLAPLPSGILEAYAVSDWVNSPNNDLPACIEEDASHKTAIFSFQTTRKLSGPR